MGIKPSDIKYNDRLGQGRWVAEKVYDFKRNGYFIELGAYDGKDCSHTYPLEKYLGWNGICIEPSKEQWEVLFRDRDCCVDGSVVWHTDGEEVLFLSGVKKRYDKMSSGIEGYALKRMTDEQKKETLKEMESSTRYTRTLQTILKKHNAPKFIEFLSLDTEGAEYEVLKNFPFNEYTFGAMVIERDIKQEKSNQIRSLLESHQYVYDYRGRCDDYYIYITVKQAMDRRIK
jgi:hypothetical protein